MMPEPTPTYSPVTFTGTVVGTNFSSYGEGLEIQLDPPGILLDGQTQDCLYLEEVGACSGADDVLTEYRRAARASHPNEPFLKVEGTCSSRPLGKDGYELAALSLSLAQKKKPSHVSKILPSGKPPQR